MWPTLFLFVVAAVTVMVIATRAFLGFVLVLAVSVLAGLIAGLSGWPEDDIWFAQIFPLAGLLFFTSALVAVDRYQHLVARRRRASACQARHGTTGGRPIAGPPV